MSRISISHLLCRENLFLYFCKNGHLKQVQELYQSNPLILESVDIEEAFRMACRKGRLEVAQQLLAWKPTLDISANNEEAFHSACWNGNPDVAQWLQSLYPEKYRLQIEQNKLIRYWISTPLPIIGTITMASTEIEECPICYDALSNVITSCRHQFCQSCIQKLENKTKCSYCRTSNIIFKQISY